MHTTEIVDDEGYEWTIHHNGDYSGDVKLDRIHVSRVIYSERHLYRGEVIYPEHYTIDIPFEVLAEFVGQALLSRDMGELEQKSGKERLGL